MTVGSGQCIQMGISDVAGMASVIHQTAISTVTAASLHAGSANPSGGGNSSMTTKTIKSTTFVLKSIFNMVR